MVVGLLVGDDWGDNFRLVCMGLFENLRIMISENKNQCKFNEEDECWCFYQDVHHYDIDYYLNKSLSLSIN